MYGRVFVCGGTRNKKRAAALSEVNKQKAMLLFVEISVTRVCSHHIIINLVRHPFVGSIGIKHKKL